MHNVIDAIGVTFEKKGRHDHKGVKIGIWKVDGFFFRITMVDLELEKYHVVVTKSTGDGFAGPVRDVTLHLTRRQDLLELFTITSEMWIGREVYAGMLESFVRSEFFNDFSREKTSANSLN